MLENMDRYLNMGRCVVIEVPRLECETKTGVLLEWNHQNAWLPKQKIKIIKKANSVEVKIPKWLYKRKF